MNDATEHEDLRVLCHERGKRIAALEAQLAEYREALKNCADALEAWAEYDIDRNSGAWDRDDERTLSDAQSLLAKYPKQPHDWPEDDDQGREPTLPGDGPYPKP